MDSWLIIDAHFQMYRNFYAIGGLVYDGEGTGALYGFMRDLEELPELLGTTRTVFAFDGGHLLRSELWPPYKANRHKPPANEAEAAVKESLKQQIRLLRKEYLPACGYRNLLWQKNFEADDLIAAAVASLPDGDEAVIVSADNDLWQLINENVFCYNPTTRKAMTAARFTREWGLPPGMWVHIKSIAGDSCDGIEGVRGIGPKLAAGYYTGKVKPGSKAHAKIVGEGVLVHNKNLPLVRLPCPGTTTPVWRPDCVTREKIEIVYDCLGFKSLLGGGSPRGVRQVAGFGL